MRYKFRNKSFLRRLSVFHLKDLRRYPKIVSAGEHYYEEILRDHLLGQRHLRKVILAGFGMREQEVQGTVQ